MFTPLILTALLPLNPALFMRELVSWFIGVFLTGAGRPGDPSLRRAVVVFFNFAPDVFLAGQDSGIAIPTIPPASNATTILHVDMDDDSERDERDDSVHVDDDDDSAGADMDADDSARAALARTPFRNPTQSVPQASPARPRTHARETLTR